MNPGSDMPNGFGQLAHGTLSPPKPRKDGAPRRIRKCAEDPVEPVGQIVNHKVKYRPDSETCQAATKRAL